MKSTPKMALLAILAIGSIAFGLARSAPVAGQTDADAQAKIADAMRAGPTAIAQDAAILDWAQDATGNFVVLRPGNNGWSCFPDTPGTPSDDPMCVDPTWVALLQALMAKETPPPTKTLGIAYMLQGGTDPSNIDPFATKPAADGGWLTTPPHLMLLLPGKLDPSVYSTVYANGGPWIMWPGTPYEHLMVPVSDLLKPGH